MKNYKEVEMLAKNAPTGSYAAGCPAERHQGGPGSSVWQNGGCLGNGNGACSYCEIAQ